LSESKKYVDRFFGARDRGKNKRDINRATPIDVKAFLDNQPEMGAFPANRDIRAEIDNQRYSIQDINSMLGESPTTNTSLTKASPSTNGELGFPSPFVSEEAYKKTQAEIKANDEKTVDSKYGKLTVGQALGIDVAGTALQTVGAIQGIKAAEEDRLQMIAQQHGLAIENIKANANLRNLARQSAVTKSLVDRMKNIDRLTNTGGVQRQQFLDNV
jgi:hypothetical protein